MKILQAARTVLFLALTVCTFISCKKDSNPVPPNNESDVDTRGTIKDPGTPIGAAVSVTIGANGGSLTSADGALKIDVPAGAFTSDQIVSIQPITNTNSAGTGCAYRLTPHGITFSKPVTLTFTYTDSNFVNSLPAAINASYQDAEGVWREFGGAIRDTANRTVVVNTTHFSDWALFQIMRITPWRSYCDLNSTVELKVMKAVKEIQVPGELPVPGIDQPINDTEGAIIKDWTTDGGGFTFGLGSSATYHAPARLPEKNPVVITAHVQAKGNQKWMLNAFVNVGNEGVIFRVNNGAWIHAPAPMGALVANDSVRMISAAPIVNNQPAGALSIVWLNKHAYLSKPWELTFPYFQYSAQNSITYWQFRVQNNNVVPSPGYLKFTEYEGDYVCGDFLLTRAGKETITYPTTTWGEARIEGFFRVKWKK